MSAEFGITGLSLDHLKILACSAQFLNTSYSVTRLLLQQLNIYNSMDNCEINVLGRLLRRNLTRNMTRNSLAIFFSGDLEPSDFAEIMRVIAVSNIYIHVSTTTCFCNSKSLIIPSPGILMSSEGLDVRPQGGHIS
jgi:hypothetical protein